MDFDKRGLDFKMKNSQLELSLSLTSAWNQVLLSTWIPAFQEASWAIDRTTADPCILSDVLNGDLIGRYGPDNPDASSIEHDIRKESERRDDEHE